MANIQDEAAARISRRNVGATHEDKDLSCSVRLDDSDVNQEPGLFSNLRLIVYVWASLELLGPPSSFAVILVLRPRVERLSQASTTRPPHRVRSPSTFTSILTTTPYEIPEAINETYINLSPRSIEPTGEPAPPASLLPFPPSEALGIASL
ncbi:unnamed protein product [Fusarium equiseti]|uniref:Uncharacterized protein n=1 Tax=Fusarium equiseti TaxID=61235 RepID=A0A8J2J4W4_FUSEQ|nr:unnamed protein product [Fusarium equiseti]